MIINYWSGDSRVYHHTAPINMLYGLYQACFNIISEGLDNVKKRHLDMFLERYKFRGIFRERYFKIHFERRREAFID